MGMQLIGPMGADKAVLELGMSYELITDFLDHGPRLQEQL
jgi:Asp-tRNA(Asn)/Glu-tRNA(Gln) amidotransferase A subunit family amidase